MNYITFERSFDDFHEHSKNIYRVEYRAYKGEELYQNWAPSVFPLGPTLKENFPEVIEYARIRDPGYNAGEHVVSYKDKLFHEDKIYFVDPSFFKVFSFKMIKGNPTTALKKVKSVVLTESTAKKYFGDVDPMNKLLKFIHRKNIYTCIVTGVMEDVPENSHIKFNMLVSFETYVFEHNDYRLLNNWSMQFVSTFILLSPEASPKLCEEKFNDHIYEYLPEWKKKKYTIKYVLEPLLDIHLKNDSEFDPDRHGNLKVIYYLMILALSVLAISWINYINLSSSKAIERAKEVGLRKVLGGDRTQLIIQFFIESLLFYIIAIIISLFLFIILLPYSNQLTGMNISIYLFRNILNVLIILLIFLIGVVLSCWYPSFVLSSFQPAEILRGRGNFSHSKGGIILRKILVIFQFSIALIFIISTLIIYSQIDYMQNQDLGFNEDQVLVVKSPLTQKDSTYYHRLNILKLNLQAHSNVSSVTISSEIPGNQIGRNTYLKMANSTDVVGESILYINVDYDFINTYRFQLLKGRNFSKDFGTDNEAIILNETAIKMLQFHNAENALNRFVSDKRRSYNIIGILKDFHNESLRNEFLPIALYLDLSYRRGGYISLKLNSVNNRETISFLEKEWKKLFPECPTEYFFLDEYFDRQYNDDRQFGRAFFISSFITILLSCLGIMGLSYLDVTKRTKEIGIRKVLGASVGRLLFILSKDIMKMLLIANALSWPLSYIFMSNWLNNYVNRIVIPWWAFIISGLVVFLITLMSISFHTIISAMQNPVKSLRYE
jgi:putative ABC transport system permease protein